jgi:hypothetical protein
MPFLRFTDPGNINPTTSMPQPVVNHGNLTTGLKPPPALTHNPTAYTEEPRDFVVCQFEYAAVPERILRYRPPSPRFCCRHNLSTQFMCSHVLAVALQTGQCSTPHPM